MKILLYIYLAIGCASIILCTLTVLTISREFRRRYPDIKAPKTSLIEKILTIFKAVLIHYIPILNVLLLLVYLFAYEKLEERTIEKLYLRLGKEDKNEW